MNVVFEANDRMNKVMARTRKIIEEMTYTAYYHNRKLHPERSVASWGLIFDNVEQLEERYQDDLHFTDKQIELKL